MVQASKVSVELSQTDRQLLRDIRDALHALKGEEKERADGFVRLVEDSIGEFNPRLATLLQRDSVFDDEGYGQPNVGRASD